MTEKATSRALYRRTDLLRLIDPRSVAVIGASERPGAFGARAMANLAAFKGKVWPVNARYDTIGGRPCYAAVADLPEAPDLAIVTVAQPAVEEVVRACADAGVGGAVVFASGYAETGHEDLRRAQDRLSAVARESGMRILGPNCAGFVNFTSALGAAFSSSLNLRHSGAPAVGLVSQSGALGYSLSQAVEHGAAFSHLLTVGNSCDVDIADLVSFLADEPACQAIACLYEGMREPQRLLAAAIQARDAGKPLILYKIATGAEGAASALSHTGALAGSADVQRAIFERAGAVWTQSWAEFTEFPGFFANAPLPLGGGTAVITTSGGAAIIAADIAEARGEALPQPAPDTIAILESRIPEFAAARNPCDITAQVLNDPACLRDCVEALLADDTYDALIVAQTRATGYVTDRVRMFGELARKHGKPICLVWLTQWLEGPGSTEVEDEPGVAIFRSMENCFSALEAWRRRKARPAAPAGRLSAPDAAVRAAGSLDGAAGRVVGEHAAKNALAAYGIPVARELLVQDEEAAVAAAKRLGGAVALKLVSPDLPHKTEAGVVHLALDDEAAVRTAFRAIADAAARIEPAPAVDGVLVQAMAGPGLELVVGMHSDPSFGPMIMVGLGGVFVEVMRDTVLSPVPVSRAEALDMLRSLRARRLFEGFRGAGPVDLGSVADLVARVSEFAADHADELAEMDLNPVICTGNGAVVVDALIVRKG